MHLCKCFCCDAVRLGYNIKKAKMQIAVRASDDNSDNHCGNYFVTSYQGRINGLQMSYVLS